MIVDAAFQRVGYSDVEYGIVLIGNDVDVVHVEIVKRVGIFFAFARLAREGEA
jgi:hypothetical protein